MPASPPIADMCSALAYVCFEPIADVCMPGLCCRSRDSNQLTTTSSTCIGVRELPHVRCSPLVVQADCLPRRYQRRCYSPAIRGGEDVAKQRDRRSLADAAPPAGG